MEIPPPPQINAPIPKPVEIAKRTSHSKPVDPAKMKIRPPPPGSMKPHYTEMRLDGREADVRPAKETEDEKGGRWNLFGWFRRKI